MYSVGSNLLLGEGADLALKAEPAESAYRQCVVALALSVDSMWGDIPQNGSK